MPPDVFRLVVTVAQRLFAVPAFFQVGGLALQIIPPRLGHGHLALIVCRQRLFACRPVEGMVHMRDLGTQPKHKRRR
ncbi:hypothetical protein ACFL5Z_20060 [Planctomycetota bacterium]